MTSDFRPAASYYTFAGTGKLLGKEVNRDNIGKIQYQLTQPSTVPSTVTTP